MDNKKIGSFIAVLRKQKNMTQKDLAEKLNLTSKAISKWETGQGYPEITTIPILADIFGVSIGELLNGELSLAQENDIKNGADKSRQSEIHPDQDQLKTKSISYVIMTLVFVFLSFVCLMCNLLINNAIGWSLYSVGVFVVLWASFLPLFIMKKHKAIGSFIGFSISSIAYLFMLEQLVGSKGWVLPLALPIHLLLLAALLIGLILFNYTKLNRYFCISAIVFLYGVIINICVGQIVEAYINKDAPNEVSLYATVLASTFVSLVLIAVGLIKRTRKQEKKIAVHIEII